MTLVVVAAAVVAGVHFTVTWRQHTRKKNSVKAHNFLCRTRTWKWRKCRCMPGHKFGNDREISWYVFGKLR